MYILSAPHPPAPGSPDVRRGAHPLFTPTARVLFSLLNLFVARSFPFYLIIPKSANVTLLSMDF
jgi:hypothetical protein